MVAGAQLPLPVVYTGGICPALWRPLAAPHSLSVPPYTFDVTPFVGLLNDGRPHAFTLSVASGGRHGSYWYIDATLVARSDGSGRAYGGRLLAHSEGPGVAPRRTDGGAGEARGAAAGADALRFAVAATYGYEVVGELTLPAAKTGRLVRAVATARGRLRGNVDNWLWGAAGDTAGTLSWWRESSLSVGDGARGARVAWRRDASGASSFRFAEAYGGDSDANLTIQATAQLSIERSEVWNATAAALGAAVTARPLWAAAAAAADGGVAEIGWSIEHAAAGSFCLLYTSPSPRDS